MNTATFNNNLDILWNQPDARLTCDKNDKLSTISSWNVIGRLINWIADRNGSMTRKIQEAAQKTLHQIVEENNQGKSHLVYVRNSDHHIFFDATLAYSPYFPADYLAKRITEIPKFKTGSIQAEANLILAQKDRYPKSKYPDDGSNADNRVLHWDNGPLHTR